jgi:hypothetical protein
MFGARVCAGAPRSKHMRISARFEVVEDELTVPGMLSTARQWDQSTHRGLDAGVRAPGHSG